MKDSFHLMTRQDDVCHDCGKMKECLVLDNYMTMELKTNTKIMIIGCEAWIPDYPQESISR